MAVDRSHRVGPQGWSCSGGDWHHEKEGAALAQDALNPNRPVVGLNNLLDECQSQPGSPNMACLVVLHAEKLAEEFWQGLRRNAKPLVCHPHQHLRTIQARSHGYGAAVRRELDGIGEQVGEHLTQALTIRMHRWEGVRRLYTDDVRPCL